jgi:hypothetical protein
MPARDSWRRRRQLAQAAVRWGLRHVGIRPCDSWRRRRQLAPQRTTCRNVTKPAQLYGLRCVDLGDHAGVLRSGYKGERLGKTPACLLCGGSGRGRRAPLQLPYGVTVWLCAGHRDPEFLARRSGRDLVTSLMHAWLAAGCFDRRRSDALTAHLRRVQSAPARAGLPGSYAWPELRAEVERRFAAGESPRQVIDDLRARRDDALAPAPSARTIQRWFAEGRWLARPTAERPAAPR